MNRTNWPIGFLAAIVGYGSAQAQDEQEHHDEETEEIVVQATRSGRRVQDEPIRVEVLNREEIEEKLLMRPGSIAMLVNETGGVRVQVTSPALGAANIRIQGMSGRYTQLLADGLPLHGGQSSSLGLLQIPPTDLGQVEVIKGAASALYGPSALGGVINLVSRRPRQDAEGEVVVNATTRDAQDLTAYLSAPLGDWGYSVTSGLHRQSGHDLDDDAWLDIAGYERWTVRPRLYWTSEAGSSLYLTVGATGEHRDGGSGRRLLPTGEAFPQGQDTDRRDLGLTATLAAGGFGSIHLRASRMTQEHEHRYGSILETDQHDTMFAEASWSRQHGGTSWIAGLAFQADEFRSGTFPAFDYEYRVPALFAQVEHDISDELTLAGSVRLDDHSEYGEKISPRVSALFRPGPWTVRASVGKGFFAPAPFVEEIDAVGLSRLEPLSGLRAETATTSSLDIGYTSGPWETSVTLFASDIRNATRLVPIASPNGGAAARLVNVDGTTRARGSELLLRYRREAFVVTSSYVITDAEEPASSDGAREEVPLTPRHTAGVVVMWEEHGRGRVGFEAYYSGSQRLEYNPFRARSPDYWELGVLGEIVLGRVRLFLNAENLLDVRQTHHDPLLLPQPAFDGRRTVDVWGPTDGFIVNGGIRIQL